MKKVYVRRILLVLFTLLFLFLYIFVFGRYFFSSGSSTKMRLDGFYMEKENSLDVVLMGASETYSGYAPGLAYDKYGFTSYSLGIPGGACSLIKYQIEDVLQYQKPQIIVMEVNSFLYENDEQLYSDAKLRLVTDNMPYGKHKKEILKKFPTEDDDITYHIPFLKYHGQTNYGSAIVNMASTVQLENRGYSVLKGVYTMPKRDTNAPLYDIAQEGGTVELNPIAEKELRDMLTYCQKNKINILFTRFPHVLFNEDGLEQARRAERAGEIIKEYGFDFINFEKYYGEIGLEMPGDFYNPEHMNVYGQQKFTNYLGGILCEEYGVKPGKLNKELRKEWKECARYTNLYTEYAKEKIEEGGSEKSIYERIDILYRLDKRK